MPVEIKIYGEHATDALAELTNLANALNGPVAGVAHTEGPRTSVSASVAPKAEPTADKSPVGIKKLPREEQEIAVKEMIENGCKDERFDLITVGRQNEVEKGITDKEKAEAGGYGESASDLDDMFGDDAAATPEVITNDMFRQKMGEIGKDADGQAIQAKCVDIQKILTKYIPKGADVKVGNIPADKLATAYAEMLLLED